MTQIRRENGSGGKYMMEFLKKNIITKFNCKIGEIKLDDMEDATDINESFVFTTDSYVVSPPIFPGGSIGSLAICGTSNDLAVIGAEPKFFSFGLVVQEGFELEKLEKITDDMKRWLDVVGGKIVTGDMKVVESRIDVIINTAGIGTRCKELERNLEVVREYRRYEHRWIRNCGAEADEAIIISGNIAEHAVAVLFARDDMGFKMKVSSDVYPVWLFLKEALKTGGVTAIKDATRGGIAAALNEIAEKSKVGIFIEEDEIPIRQEVRNFCEVLGLDPFVMANEGTVVMSVVRDMADEVLKALKRAGRKNARIVGYTTKKHGEVVMRTIVGSKRVIPMPAGDPVPRIC